MLQYLSYSSPVGGEFTREYIDATVPEMAFGEFWDTCEVGKSYLAQKFELEDRVVIIKGPNKGAIGKISSLDLPNRTVKLRGSVNDVRKLSDPSAQFY